MYCNTVKLPGSCHFLAPCLNYIATFLLPKQFLQKFRLNSCTTNSLKQHSSLGDVYFLTDQGNQCSQYFDLIWFFFHHNSSQRTKKKNKSNQKTTTSSNKPQKETLMDKHINVNYEGQFAEIQTPNQQKQLIINLALRSLIYCSLNKHSQNADQKNLIREQRVASVKCKSVLHRGKNIYWSKVFGKWYIFDLCGRLSRQCQKFIFLRSCSTNTQLVFYFTICIYVTDQYNCKNLSIFF